MKQISWTGAIFALLYAVLVFYFCSTGVTDGFDLIPITIIGFPASIGAWLAVWVILWPISSLMHTGWLFEFVVNAAAFIAFGGLQWYAIGLATEELGRKLGVRARIALGGTLGLLLALVVFFFFTKIGNDQFHSVIEALKGEPPIPATNEIVMPPNATITATTDAGTITIRSEGPARRVYTWDGGTRSVVMRPFGPRNDGARGIKADSSWAATNGISKGFFSESQRDFSTNVDAEAWLHKNCDDCVYNDNGLTVGFYKRPDTEEVIVFVIQFYIGEKRPEKLSGSKNSEIILSWDNSK